MHADRLGDQFGLVVFDECHHLPGAMRRDAARMSAAVWRLGLTATPERSDGRHADYGRLIGPVVYELPLAAVRGAALADYEVVRIPVYLSRAEQARYDALARCVRRYVAERRQDAARFQLGGSVCRQRHVARGASGAARRIGPRPAIEDRAAEKLRVLEDLFRLHAGSRTIVFAGSNAMAREVSRRFLIPCLLSHCRKKERLEVLRGLEEGGYPALVANQVLDEGVDLPAAKVAIVLGGKASTRQAKQRLGRDAAQIGARTRDAVRGRHGGHQRRTPFTKTAAPAMLTREHAIAEYEGGRVLPDRLDRRRHAALRRLCRANAGRLSAWRRPHAPRTARAKCATFSPDEPDCPTRRIEAFCKLLDDASVYDYDRHGGAAELRQASLPPGSVLASAGVVGRPAVRQGRTASEGGDCRRPGNELGTKSTRRLFCDIIECHRLREFAGYADGAALLARYNVAQVQAALFDAVEMTVWARDDFKTVLRYAKLARLLHTIRQDGDEGYVMRFDGPASLLRTTRRYGAAMARFLPALVACRGWRMHALVRRRGGGWVHRLELSPADGLTSHLPPPEEFDSSVEQAFAEKWGDNPREGWTLLREGEILHREQRVFVPDFVLRHADGRRRLLEIVGFWTPEYLEAKLKTLRLFRGEPIVVALADSRRTSFDAQLIASGIAILRFKSSLNVKSVLACLRS